MMIFWGSYNDYTINLRNQFQNGHPSSFEPGGVPRRGRARYTNTGFLGFWVSPWTPATLSLQPKTDRNQSTSSALRPLLPLLLKMANWDKRLDQFFAWNYFSHITYDFFRFTNLTNMVALFQRHLNWDIFYSHLLMHKCTIKIFLLGLHHYTCTLS